LRTENPRMIGVLITLNQNYPYLYAENDVLSILWLSLLLTHLPLHKNSLVPKNIDSNIAFSIELIPLTCFIIFEADTIGCAETNK